MVATDSQGPAEHALDILRCQRRGAIRHESDNGQTRALRGSRWQQLAFRGVEHRRDDLGDQTSTGLSWRYVHVLPHESLPLRRLGGVGWRHDYM